MTDSEVTNTLEEDGKIKFTPPPKPPKPRTELEIFVDRMVACVTDTSAVTARSHEAYCRSLAQTTVCLMVLCITQRLGFLWFYMHLNVCASEEEAKVQKAVFPLLLAFALQFYCLYQRAPITWLRIAPNASHDYLITTCVIGLCSGFWLSEYEVAIPPSFLQYLLMALWTCFVDHSLASNRQKYVGMMVGPPLLAHMLIGYIGGLGLTALDYVVDHIILAAVLMQLTIGQIITTEVTAAMISVTAELTMRCLIVYATGQQPVPAPLQLAPAPQPAQAPQLVAQNETRWFWWDT